VRETKAWGSVKHAFSLGQCAVSVLDVKAGGYSSRHYHRARVNRFLVVSGAIEVVEYDPTGRYEIRRRRLEADDVADVDAGTVHRFEVKQPGVVVEIYYPADVKQDDIERLDVGGCES